MPLYLDTRNETCAAVAICDRCHEKFPIAKLDSDPNVLGLRVCEECCDKFDPWRLPPRATERIDVRYPRPEEPLDPGPENDWASEKTGSYK